MVQTRKLLYTTLVITLLIPNTLSMILPQDYVNYTKIARIGSDGIERVLYPASKTSDPFAITQNTDGTYDFGQQKRVVTVTFSNVTGFVNAISGRYLSHEQLRTQCRGG